MLAGFLHSAHTALVFGRSGRASHLWWSCGGGRQASAASHGLGRALTSKPKRSQNAAKTQQNANRRPAGRRTGPQTDRWEHLAYAPFRRNAIPKRSFGTRRAAKRSSKRSFQTHCQNADQTPNPPKRKTQNAKRRKRKRKTQNAKRKTSGH